EQRGWRETVDGFSSTYLRELDYLDFAALTHISIGKKKIKPVIVLGPYLAYPLGQREEIPAGWPTNRDYYGVPLPNRLQYGVGGGVGVEWRLGKWSVQVDGRYRSALGGVFATGDSQFTFSNLRGVQVEGTLVYWLR
ncbi:MAG: outer membrane beta-barrel protein, partial [Bacteroidota bacterium]